VDGVEDEAAVAAEDLAALEDLGPDLLRRPEGQAFWVSTPPPQNTMSRPNSAFSLRASMPAAESWTGLRMSKPLSMKAGMSEATAPQECLKVFQAVWAWIQSLMRL